MTGDAAMTNKPPGKDAQYSAQATCPTCNTTYVGRSNHSQAAAQSAAGLMARNCQVAHERRGGGR